MALINCPECSREISDRAATCIGCGCPITSNEHTPTAESPILVQNETDMSTKNPDSSAIIETSSRDTANSTSEWTPPTNNARKTRSKKKIFLLSFGCLILVAGIVVATVMIIRSTPNWRLRNSSYAIAIEVFFESFYETNREIDAIEFLTDENYVDSVWTGWTIADWKESITLIGVDVLNGAADEWSVSRFYSFEEFYRIAHNRLPSEITEKWVTFFDEIERLKNTVTPLRDIYANPHLFYNEQAVVVGVVRRNDIQRGVLEIDVGAGWPPRYPLEVRYKIAIGDNIIYVDEKWYDAQERDRIIVLGVLVEQPNRFRSDAFMLASFIDYIHEADLSVYTLSISEQAEDLPDSAAPPSGDLSEQESDPSLLDLFPHFQLNRIIRTAADTEGNVISYISDGVYSEVFFHYHDILIALSDSYVLQNLSPSMQGLAALIPDTDRSVYILLSNGAIINEEQIDMVTVAILISPESNYHEIEGTLIDRHTDSAFLPIDRIIFVP